MAKPIFSTIKKVKVIIFCFFGFFISPLNAQNLRQIDSLRHLIEKDNTRDSIKFEALEELSKNRSIDPSVRLKHAKDFLILAKNKEINFWLYKANFRLGQIYKYLGKPDSSAYFYYEALEHSKIMGDSRRSALIHTSLATVYRLQENYDKALESYHKSHALLEEASDFKNLSTSLMNTGELYRITKQFDSAIYYFNKSAIILDTINFSIGKAYNLGNIGLVYAEIKQIKKAENYLNQAIEILEKEGEYYPIIVYNLSMADIYAMQNKLDIAIKLVEHNLQIAIENSLREQIRDANLKISELYSQKENFKKAYYHQSQYLVYRDSINNEETIRKMADLRADYEISQKQIEVDLLEKQKKQQNIIFIAMLVIIILLVVLLFLYYRNYKRKQALNMIILERKEEAEAQRDQLEAINQTKEKFLSIISHDLLGPVNSMKGLTSLLKISIDTNSKKDLEHIQKLFEDSVRNLSSLLTNLLDWSVTQQGAIPYKPQIISLHLVVNELLDLFANMAQTKNISLRSTVTKSAKLWADEDSLKTILRNLVSNAIKFTLANGKITISNVMKDNFIVIKVSDTGLGMSQEKIDELLGEDKFSQSQGTSGEKGIGLGLQLVKEFVRVNKGWIEIASQEGKGTTFSIYLPLNEYQIV